MQHVPWDRKNPKEMTRKFKEFDDIPNSKLEHLINEYVHNQKYREMLYSHFIDGLSFESTAEKHNFSVAQTKKIIYKYGDKVLKYIR